MTFRIPVLRGKNLDIVSAHSLNPRHVVTRRGMAWRGVARQAAEEECAWMSLLFSCSYKWGKNLPYKEVQLCTSVRSGFFGTDARAWWHSFYVDCGGGIISFSN